MVPVRIWADGRLPTEYLSRRGGRTDGAADRVPVQRVVPGPRLITLSDGGVTLEVACAENDLSWTLINRGEEPVDLHITLAAAVTARAEGSVAHLSREGVSMAIHGITRLEGQRIIATAPARGAAPLRRVLEVVLEAH